jgi:phage I-like protein
MKRTIELILLATTAQRAAFDPANPPKRMLMIPWGETKTVEPKLPRLVVGDITVAALAVNQAKLGFDRVALDYIHNTVEGSPEFLRTKEPREIAATGVVETVPGEGVYLSAIEWTPDGPKNAMNYPDISPAPRTDAQGNVVFIHSFALCRQGAGEGLRFARLSVETNEGDAMDPKLKELLCRLLKLPAETAEDGITAALDTAAGQIACLSVTLPLVDAHKGAFETLTAKLTAAEGKIATFSTELIDLRKQVLLSDAARDGKVIPLSADAVAKMDMPTLTDLVGKLPKGVVPLSAHTPAKVDDPASSNAALDKVAVMCGMDPAKVRELNKK